MRAGGIQAAKAGSAGALLCLAALLGSPPAKAAETQADAVYVNGNIYTLDGQSAVVSAVAVLGGRFIAVGSDAEIERYVGPETETVDLRGAPAVPGLIDSHLHLADAGKDVGLTPFSDVTTVSEALARIEAAVATKQPGEWIISGEWSPIAQLVEQRSPTAAELDAVAPHNPVFLDGDAASANSLAMELAGIHQNTPDPEGGVLQRGPAGDLTGVLEGTAADLIRNVVPPPSVETLAVRYMAASNVANGFGLTSVVTPLSEPDELRALQGLVRDGKLTLRYSVILPPPDGGASAAWEAAIISSGVSSGFGDEWLRLDSLGEMPADGGMTYGTALMRDAYPHDAGYYGTPTMSAEQLNAIVGAGARNDWRFTIHAVGDAAVDRVLDAYEAAGEERSIAGRRFIVLRGSLIQPDQLQRMKKLGVILQMENMFMWDKAAAVERNLGTEAANRTIPTRLAIDILGIDNVSQGSDFPTNSMNPWLNLYLAVTRKDHTGRLYGADQAIGRGEALRMYTTSGAYASFEEDAKGSIAVGKLADMVVLDRDYMTIPADQIKDVQAIMTIVGGQVVFRR